MIVPLIADVFPSVSRDIRHSRFDMTNGNLKVIFGYEIGEGDNSDRGYNNSDDDELQDSLNVFPLNISTNQSYLYHGSKASYPSVQFARRDIPF